MPKMKTKSSAKKRFRLTASGKVRFNSAYRRHRLISKDKSAKERNQGTKILCDADARKVIRNMLPYRKPPPRDQELRPCARKAVCPSTRRKRSC